LLRRNSPFVAEPGRGGYGQSTAALPGAIAEVDFLGDLTRVVELNTEVAYGAFDPMDRWP
jgi:hypothetical protein